jgi:hypothetical protein
VISSGIADDQYLYPRPMRRPLFSLQHKAQGLISIVDQPIFALMMTVRNRTHHTTALFSKNYLVLLVANES